MKECNIIIRMQNIRVHNFISIEDYMCFETQHNFVVMKLQKKKYISRIYSLIDFERMLYVHI